MQEKRAIAVIGAVNVDVSGTSLAPLIAGDSNPGRVRMTLGGVGRNIAENLCRLGASVSLITVLGEDGYGVQVNKSCRELGIDLTLSRVIPGERSSTYLCINDADGIMRLAVSDMDICGRIDPEFLRERMEAVNGSALAVLDANLSEEAIAFLTENCRVPLFADPVSIPKAARLKDHLAGVFCVKPNRREAEVLTGHPIKGQEDLPKAAEVLLQKGVKMVFISLGGEGVYYDDGSNRGILPCCPGEIVSTTGCGDAFLAAAAYGYSRGLGIRTMALTGLAAAALCAQAEGAILQHMSLALLNEKLRETGGESIEA